MWKRYKRGDQMAWADVTGYPSALNPYFRSNFLIARDKYDLHWEAIIWEADFHPPEFRTASEARKYCEWLVASGQYKPPIPQLDL